MENDDEIKRYAASGMAAYLPGMVYMLELMQRQVDDFRAQLARMQNGMQGLPDKEEDRPVPWSDPAKKKRRKTAASYWAKMTKAERSEEMRRRMAVSAARAAKERKARETIKERKPHPRDADHPDHEAFLAKLRRGVRAKKRASRKAAADLAIAS